MLTFLKRYYFYVFAILLLSVITLFKFFPNYFSQYSLANSPSTEETKVDSDEPKGIGDTNVVLYIDLSGAVKNPGIYKVPSSYRVGDLLKEGGGFSKDASALWVSRNINLSKSLTDSQKIYIPFEWETYGDCSCVLDTIALDIPNLPKGTLLTEKEVISDKDNGDDPSSEEEDTPNVNDTTLINVNSASLEELDSLSGIGPSYAKKIIDNRIYKDMNDLISKSGVPKSVLEKISTLISF